MQGDAKVIVRLNEILCGQLTAINQLYLHGRMGINWGYNKIGTRVTKQSITLMKQASKLTDRILFLEGLPNLQKLNLLSIGESIAEQIENDFAMYCKEIDLLRQVITECTALHDHGSRELLEGFLVEYEEFADWLDEQRSLIREMGIEHYLASAAL